MAAYSTNALVQNTIYGATNSELDTVCGQARQLVTSIINAKMGLKADLSTVPQVVTDCATLLAAAIVSTSPEDKVESNTYWKQGMIILESMGEEVDSGIRTSGIRVDRFG